MLRSSLLDFSDASIRFRGTITVLNTGTAAAPKNRYKKVIFKYCASPTGCISKINDTEIDHATNDIDVIMAIYNLI